MQNRTKRKFYRQWWFWTTGIIISAAALSLRKNNKICDLYKEAKENMDTSPGDSLFKDLIQEQEEKINYKNFLRIRMGDSYDSVTSIIGNEAEEILSDVNGIKNLSYSRRGPGIGNISITLENNTVVGKAQAGLGKINSNVTLEKYDQVEEGMTYEEIVSILGEGELTSHTSVMTMDTMIFSWINKDGSNMNCSFSGGRMKAKAQFNLK